MIHKVKLNPPVEISEKIVKRIDELIEIEESSNIQLSEKKLERVKKDLKNKLRVFKSQTGALKRRLIELNEILEGVVEETNFPFEGASNITLSYAAGIAKTFRAVFNRTAYQDPNIFSAQKNKKNVNITDEQLLALEEGVNINFNSDTNGLDTLKLGTIPVFRDGTLIIEGYWKRKIERCSDFKIYKSSADFIADYPTPEVAGISDEEYKDILKRFLLDDKVRVEFEYDNILYDGIEYNIIPLAECIFYPTYAKDLSDMVLYGKEFYISEPMLKQRAKHGMYYKSVVDRVISKKETARFDQWSATRNFIEGLNFGNEDKEVKRYKLAELVYKTDLDNDGVLEKYFVTYDVENDEVLSFKKYHLRNNIDCWVDFRLVEREGRWIGVSLLAEGQDKFKLLDDIHRHRNNVRMLVSSPMLLVNERYKEELDFMSENSIVKPGRAFYVSDTTNAVKQLVIQDLDRTNSSTDEENLIIRYLEFSLGPTQALSGKETPSDPRAPMGKTIALLQQANQRIDDYLDTFKKSFPRLAKLHCALLAQYGPDVIEYKIEQNGKLNYKEFPRELLLVDEIQWKDKRRSVTLSPEFAMQRLGGLMQIYTQLLPLIMQGNKVAVELWNRMVIASGEPNKEAIMITQEQMQSMAMLAIKNQIMGELQQRGLAGQPPVEEEEPPKKKTSKGGVQE